MIIHIVEHSALPVKRTLNELQVPRSTFYRWYKQYQEDGPDGLIDRRPNPRQIWNRIPKEVKQQVVELALEHPDRSPREISWLFTDEKGYFISESRVYRILKAFPAGHRDDVIWWKVRYFECLPPKTNSRIPPNE